MSPRSCGSCDACCRLLRIPATELTDGTPFPMKETGTPCSHLCTKGCGIYERRPAICSRFRCLWLQGLGDRDQRPEQSGVMIFTRPVEPLARLGWPLSLAVVFAMAAHEELDLGAHPLVRRIGATMPVILLDADGNPTGYVYGKQVLPCSLPWTPA